MIIGLTGGIASGKSLCSDWFTARAVSVIDADVIARKVVTKGSPVLQELAAAFGNDVLQDDGNLNRATLRTRAFVNDDARACLNTIMQPRIRERLLQELERAPRQPYRILSAPLLLENRLDALCDVVLAVDVSERTQLERGSQRDQQQQAAIAAIIAAQISRAERLQRANFIVDNEGDTAQTYLPRFELRLQAIKKRSACKLLRFFIGNDGLSIRQKWFPIHYDDPAGALPMLSRLPNCGLPPSRIVLHCRRVLRLHSIRLLTFLQSDSALFDNPAR